MMDWDLFVRRKGKTESNFVPLIQSELFKELKDKIKPDIKTKSSNKNYLNKLNVLTQLRNYCPKTKNFIYKSIRKSKIYQSKKNLLCK